MFVKTGFFLLLISSLLSCASNLPSDLQFEDKEQIVDDLLDKVSTKGKVEMNISLPSINLNFTKKDKKLDPEVGETILLDFNALPPNSIKNYEEIILNDDYIIVPVILQNVKYNGLFFQYLVLSKTQYALYGIQNPVTDNCQLNTVAMATRIKSDVWFLETEEVTDFETICD